MGMCSVRCATLNCSEICFPGQYLRNLNSATSAYWTVEKPFNYEVIGDEKYYHYTDLGFFNLYAFLS